MSTVLMFDRVHQKVVGVIRVQNTYVQDLIIDAIANDYESFETIVHEVNTWSLEQGRHVDIGEIRDGLLELIQCGYAKAYSLSPTSDPMEIGISELRSRFESAYYLLTEQGKRSIGAQEVPE